MSESPFSVPRRQDPLGVIILFGQNLRNMVRILAGLVFASVYSDWGIFSVTNIVLFGALIMAVYTVFQYLRFKFYIAGDELILEKGVFRRERLSIPLDRIQTVHLSQNLLQQVIQLTGVRIDTAGSGQEELKISALKREDALVLQALLEGSNEEVKNQSLEGEVAPQAPRKTLVELTIPKLLVVGLTQNHLRSGLIAFAVVWGYLVQFEDVIRDYLDVNLDYSPEEVEQAVSSIEFGMTLIAFMILTFLAISVMISLVRTVIRHFGLKATLGPKTIQVSSGLIKRNEFTIPLNKIQIMRWQGNYLRRIPGFESVLIRQGRSGAQPSELNVEIPACYTDQTQALEQAIYGPEMEEPLHAYSPHPFYRVYMSIWALVIGLLPFGIAFLLLEDWKVALAYALYALIAILWVRKFVSTISLSTNGSLIQYRKGWLFTDRSLIKVYKIQSMTYRQSIFQARRGSAHLTLYTAGGSLTMRFMPESFVKELYNYYLYKVEVSEESWM